MSKSTGMYTDHSSLHCNCMDHSSLHWPCRDTFPTCITYLTCLSHSYLVPFISFFATLCYWSFCEMFLLVVGCNFWKGNAFNIPVSLWSVYEDGTQTAISLFPLLKTVAIQCVVIIMVAKKILCNIWLWPFDEELCFLSWLSSAIAVSCAHCY